MRNPQSLAITYDFETCKRNSLQGFVTPHSDLCWLVEGFSPAFLASTCHGPRNGFPDGTTINFNGGRPAVLDCADKIYEAFKRKESHRRFQVTLTLQSSPPPPPSVSLAEEENASLEAAKLLAREALRLRIPSLAEHR